MASKFRAPEQWEDWCSWVLGIWLCISPWALFFENEPVATAAAVVTGVLLIAIEGVTLTAFHSWEEWMNVLLGAWLIAAPWTLKISSVPAITNFEIVGLLVLALAVYELRAMKRVP
jgi:SPW repeat